MVFEVYQIVKANTFGNSHFVCRDETWSTRLDKVFSNLQEAREYVIKSSMKIIVRFQIHPTYEFCEDFCFNNDRFLAEREYFVGKPNIEAIQNALKRNGIKILSPK